MVKVNVFENIMSRNEKQAQENKKIIGSTLMINIMSSPGAGKTTLLEATLKLSGKRLKAAVIEGDIATSNDARRIKKHTKSVYQIKTENYGGGCHLDAKMVNKGLKKLLPGKKHDIIIIENVGNLICPADFNLGEDKKVVLLAVTEGEDKPLKYPLMFEVADLVLLSKSDLAPVLETDIKLIKKNIKKINSKVQIIEISSKAGIGLEKWTEKLAQWAGAKIKRKNK